MLILRQHCSETPYCNILKTYFIVANETNLLNLEQMLKEHVPDFKDDSKTTKEIISFTV